MPVVDTLKLKTRLSDSGMPEAQAQVLVEELDEVLSTAITAQVATKADVVELRAEINADVVELRAATKADMAELRAAIHNLEERFEQRFEGVDRRFEGVDRRFEQMDKRFEQVDKRLDQVQADIRQIRQWQMGLYVFIALGFLGMIARDLLLK